MVLVADVKMDAAMVEEAIVDWHRLGRREALPCNRLFRLNVYFSACADSYVTFHLKTSGYFDSLAYQIEYWKVVSRELDLLMSVGENNAIRHIESAEKVRLNSDDCILYGHTLLVTLGGWEDKDKFVAKVMSGARSKMKKVLLDHVLNLYRYINRSHT